MSELFAHVADFESVKILLSSRPIPACVQAFSKFPKLHLQDLTRDDIKHYVEDKLGQDILMERLNRVQGGATSQLVESLTSKACGVFLWVRFIEMGRLIFQHPQCELHYLNCEVGSRPSLAPWDHFNSQDCRVQ